MEAPDFWDDAEVSQKKMKELKDVEKSIIKKYRKEIYRRFIRAINDFEMMKSGDVIAVCISGGKDSFLLAKCMQELKRHN